MVDYNKALLDKWYTQAEIDQMRAAVNSWQSAKDAVANMNAQKSSSNQATNTQTNTWMNSMSQTKAQDNSRNSQYGTWDVATIQQNQTQNNVTPTTTPWTTWSEIKTNNFQESWDKLSASQQASLMKRKEFSDYINSKWYTVKKEEPTTTTTPTTKKTTTQTTPKQQQWDYQDNSQARMDQIANNLRGYEDSMPRLFDNWAEYYNFFIKDKWRSQDQIDFLEKYFDDYKKFSPYNNWSSSALWDWLANGDVPKEYLDYLRSRDPAKYQEVLSYKQDTEDRIKHEAYLDSLSSEAWFESEESETKKYPWAVEYAKEMGYLVDENWDWIDDYRYIPPTPEELTKQDRVNQIDSRVMEIKNMQKNMLDDYVEQYPWVPKATLMWIVQDRTKDLQREYDDLMVERAWLVWNIEYMQNERNAQMDARQDTINNLYKAYWMYYQYSPWGIAERTEAEYAANNITLDQADSWNETQKQMALQNVLDWYYEKYWDIIQRSEQQVINDVIAYAKKNWIWLAQALQENFIDQLKSKDAYKAYEESLTMWWWNWSLEPIKDAKWNITWYVKIDKSTWNVVSISWDTLSSLWLWWWKSWVVWSSYETNTQPLEDFISTLEEKYTIAPNGWSWWGKIRSWWCWTVVNDYLWKLWDSISLSEANDIKKYATSWTPAVWWVAYFDWTQSRATPETKKHWHVAIVTNVDDANWKITVLESNVWTWLRYKDYNISDVTGYYVPEWIKSYWYGESPMQATYVEMVNNWADNKDLDFASRAYNILYRNAANGNIDHFLNSENSAKFIAALEQQQFSNQDNVPIMEIKSLLRNKYWDSINQDALNDLITLARIQLRKESWAAISQSEWALWFSQILPEPWETYQQSFNKLAWLEQDYIKFYFDKYWDKADNYKYVPIFSWNSPVYKKESASTSTSQTTSKWKSFNRVDWSQYTWQSAASPSNDVSYEELWFQN